MSTATKTTQPQRTARTECRESNGGAQARVQARAAAQEAVRALASLKIPAAISVAQMMAAKAEVAEIEAS